MEIEYDNSKIQKLFIDLFSVAHSKNLLQKKFGLENTQSIKRRIIELKASKTFGQFLKTGLGKPHPLSGNLDNCFGISVSKNYRLIVKPKTEDLSLYGLNNCETVIIKGVADYHGEKNNWIFP